MSISVSTWAELISALADEHNTGTIDWVGDSYLNSVTITVGSNSAIPNITSNISKINFNGLTIGTLQTRAISRDFDNFPNGSSYDTWLNGFCALKLKRILNTANQGIFNLTINHIYLDHPRDILVDCAYLHNVYCYDIYADSVEDYSPWLRGSGKSGYEYNMRANSAYLVRSGATRQAFDGTGIPKYTATEDTKFINCIINVRTKNAGICIPQAWYYNSEINYDYTIDWNEIAAERSEGTTDEWLHLEIFPVHNLVFYNCTVNGKFYLENTGWAVSLCNTVLEDISGHSCFFETVSGTINTVYNFWTEKVPNFGGIYEYGDYFFADGRNTHTSTGVGSLGFSTMNLFIVNNGDIRWQTIIEDICETFGDAHNIDIFTLHEMPVISDDDFRQPQYDNTAEYLTDDWERRIWPATNGGLPFLPMWYYPLHEDPSGGGSTSGYYISIYDMNTKQDEFDNNGVVLHPTRCRVTEELNAGFNLLLEHPKDTDGKWRYIIEMNIIKCLGQLFIIRKVSAKTVGNSTMYTAYAEHISYHLNDYWLFPDAIIAGYHGQTLINSILTQMFDGRDNNQVRYNFDIKTNLDADPSFREWYDRQEGNTAYEMLIGTNGFTYLIGGELYRDNFNISIYSRMENAQNDAFTLHPDLNLKGIERTVDMSTFCSDFRGYDDYDGWFEQSWAYSSLGLRFPHHVVRSKKFTVSDPDNYSWTDFCIKVGKYFNKFCAPLVSYRIQVQDLKRHPEYKDFVNNYRFKVGDIGKVWDTESGKYLDLEITKTVKDGITGDTLEVVIGSERSFTRPNGGINTTASRNYESIDGDSYNKALLKITQQPQSAAEPTGAEHFFSVRAQSGLPISYQWQYRVEHGELITPWYDIEGGRSQDYKVDVDMSIQFYKWRCVVSNAAETLFTNVVSITIIDENDWIYRIENNGAVLIGYTGSQHELILPSTLGGYPLKRIGSSAFTNNENITKITIPDGVEVIE